MAAGNHPSETERRRRRLLAHVAQRACRTTGPTPQPPMPQVQIGVFARVGEGPEYLIGCVSKADDLPVLLRQVARNLAAELGKG
ncbi:MAG: hypothetical protein ABWY93_18620 [Mycobacterium sp.]